jgi:hypothetical protein
MSDLAAWRSPSRHPFPGIAVARDDHGSATGALEEELVDVAAFLFAHGLESEVIEN